MKHLFKSTVLENMVGPSNVVKACFFFNEQGLPHDTTFAGMLRGLLCHLLDISIEIYESIVDDIRFEANRSRTTQLIDWIPKLLRRILTLTAQRAKGKRILIFVDALDECAERDRTLVVSFLHDWHKRARDYGVILYICISSRPEAAIDMDLFEVLTGSMLLQNENYRDIATYVNESLGSKRDPRRKNYYANFAAKVAEKADGVFLWVILVIPTLKTAIARGKTETELNLLLEKIPPQLKELYRGILKRIDEECLQETMRMLQFATLARRPLFVDEFRHALAFYPGAPFRSISEWHESPDFVEADFMVQAKLQSISGGLLEVCRDPYDEQNTSRRKRDRFKSYYVQHSDSSPPLSPSEREHRSPSHQVHPSAENYDKLSQNIPAIISKSERPNDFKTREPIGNPTRSIKEEGGLSTHSFKPRSNFKPTSGGPLPIHERKFDWEDQQQRRIASDNSRTRDTDSYSISASTWEWSDSQFIRSKRGIITDHSPEGSNQVIRLIHETEKQFFVKGEGFSILCELIQSHETRHSLEREALSNRFTSPRASYIIGGHEYMANTFFKYLDLAEVQPVIKEMLGRGIIQWKRSKVSPLLQYIAEHWLIHVSSADIECGSQRWVMNKLTYYSVKSTDIYICWAARENILSWIDEAEELGIDVNTPGLAYGRAIMDAVLNGHLGMVTRLVKAGANVNGVTGGLETTLRIAERLNNQEMVKLLKDLGAAMEQVHYLPPNSSTIFLDNDLGNRLTAVMGGSHMLK